MSKVLQPSGSGTGSRAFGADAYFFIVNGWFEGSLLLYSNETSSQIKYRTSGTLSNLWVNISANTLDAAAVFKSRVNGADGNLLISVTAGVTGAFEDASNFDSITAGDNVCGLYSNGTATVGSITIRSIATCFAAGSNTVSRIGTGYHSLTGASATRYFPVPGRGDYTNSTEANAQSYFGSAGTLKNLFTNISTNGRSSTSTMRTRVNGANGNCVVSISAAATGVFEDTSNSDTLAAGDLTCFSVTPGGASGTFTWRLFSLELETTNKKFLTSFGYVGGLAQNDNLTRRFGLSGGFSSPQSTESFVHVKAGIAATLSYLSVYVSSNTIAAGIDSTFKTRIDGVDGNGFVTIGGLATGRFTDATNTDAVTAGQLISLKFVTGNDTGGTTAIILQMASLTWENTESGTTQASDSRAARTAGQAAVGSDRPARTIGHVIDSSARPARTAGLVIGSDSRPARTQGVETGSSERSGRTEGSVGSTDSRAARTRGVETGATSRPARTSGKTTTSSDRSSRTQGVTVGSSSRSARTAGLVVGASTRFARTEGKTTVSSARLARTTGKVVDSNSRSARTSGLVSLPSSRSARTQGAVIGSSSRPARTAGAGVILNARGARTQGVALVASDVRNGRTWGAGVTFDSRSARVEGYGNPVAHSSRGARTFGAMENDQLTAEFELVNAMSGRAVLGL